MNLIDRVKNILVTPKTEWPVISAEPVNRNDLILKYVLVLAAIPAVLGLLFSLVISMFWGGMGILFVLVSFVIHLAMAIVGVFLLAFIADFLAPSFGGTKNYDQALKLAAYSMTPIWVASITLVIPLLGLLIVLAALVYAVYLLFLGVQAVMKSPADKAPLYTVVVVVVAIIVGLIVGAVQGAVMGAVFLSSAGTSSGVAAAVQRHQANAKLDAFTKGIEAASKKMEAANKSGDQNAQAAAAMEVLGAAVSGGKKVEPLSVEEVKAFVPDKFAGLPKTSSAAERSGVSTLMVTTAKATYSDNGGKTVRLEVTDAGGAGAMMGLASWMGAMNMEREDDNGAERTKKEGSRIVHEKVSKTGGDNEYSVVLADRFVVKTLGSGVDLATLKGGVSGMDLAKLESMKDVGVAKN